MKLEELIKNKKLKFTPARQMLLEIFSKASQPLAYEDIKSQITMDKATFYRNVTTFEASGILNGFESNDKKRYYEMTDKQHAHFICSECHNVECLDEELQFTLKDYKVDNIIVYGVCKKCCA
ncbi:MAG: Peroxide stress regulator / Ferric uptake regulation protein [uncultured Sulfurovum sp.]|uniref:Peroxide stress regulator / Ferric uptake regulation protein n=1 Tax=uncultured Sulfurovum sp. TaxID=269237 RepID=A0A6S6SWP5_9BACT|nr:MAG: Peroxide stress regulator / Ferric uptake regulation protein [uncultured Sulfurovum sp.]